MLVDDLAMKWARSSARMVLTTLSFNTLRPRTNGRHFPDDILKCISLNESVWLLIKISLKFVPKDPINNIPALVQMMAWRWPGDKPLSEPMMVRLLAHICVTRPQWVNFPGSAAEGLNVGVQILMDQSESICKYESVFFFHFWGGGWSKYSKVIIGLYIKKKNTVHS